MAISAARSPRDCEKFISPKCTTREDVGPGLYSNTQHKPATTVGESAVPFASLQEKTLNYNASTSSITPGPGSYINPRDTETSAAEHGNVQVCRSMMESKAKRLADNAPGSSVFKASTIARNPGPGTYAPDRQHPGEPQWASQKDKLQGRAPPVLEVGKTVPSIPIQRLDPKGPDHVEKEDQSALASAVHMRYTGRSDRADTVGPAEYDVKGFEVLEKAAACPNFHRSEQKRKLWEPSVAIDCKLPPRNNPGPGTYTEADPWEESREVPGQGSRTFQFSSGTRIRDQIQVRDDLAVPGPGTYQLAPEDARPLTDRTHFGSNVEREGWMRPLNQPFTDPYHHRVPGPGHYPATGGDVVWSKTPRQSRSVGVPKKALRVHHPSQMVALIESRGPLASFGTTDQRGCNRMGKETTPGAGTYNYHNARGASMASVVRERAGVGRKGVFGTCADRFYGSPLAAVEGVDPGKYEEDKGAPGSPRNTTLSGRDDDPAARSSFASGTKRFRAPVGAKEAEVTAVGVQDTPGPGAFDVMTTPNYRSPFRHPKSDHLSFGSGRGRFSRREHVDGRIMNENPGPGEYVEKRTRREHVVGGAGKSKAERNLAPPVGCSGAIGAGEYEVGSTLLKKTYNVSASVPVVPAKG